jgi:hypothetical protein
MWVMQPIPLFNSNAPRALVEFKSCNKQDDDTVTFSYENDNVLSVQPNGDWDVRPKGSNGPYEKFTANGNVFVVKPDSAYCYLAFEIKNA